MACPPAFHESLPYIDPEPTPEALSAARALITAELSSTSPPPPASSTPSTFSPALTAELDRVAASQPSQPLDASRYELQEPPAPDTDVAGLRAALADAYVSGTYLAARAENLQLLDRHGKNAWLLSNYHLEADLKALEADIAVAKRDIDAVNAARAQRQNHVRGEMLALDDNWKTGVARVLETELAVEELKVQIRQELKNKGMLEAAQQDS